MKLISFDHHGPRFGAVVDGSRVVDLTDRFGSLHATLQTGRMDEALVAADTGTPTLELADLSLASTLPEAEKYFCIGVNYRGRNAEYKDDSDAPKYPSVFMRSRESFTGHGQPLIRPPESDKLDYEGEIVIVIGREGRRIPRDRAREHIAGLTLMNEGTLRDWVRHAKFNVTQGKNWDRSAAMGPWLVPFTDASQLDDARILTRVNGEVRQDDHVVRMMFPVRRQIAYISTFMALAPGDIIVTGTPTGAGARFDPPRFLKPGDVVEVEVTGIGTLRNTVEDEA